jgi:hypothetical protein
LTALSEPPVLSRRTGRRSRGASEWALIAALALYAAIFLVTLRHSFLQDTWLGIVTGRDVWHSGIPRHETLTALAQGRRWVDQQWLSQLAMYTVQRVGGLGLLGVVHVALTAGSVAAATVAARRLGASAASVILILPPCALLVLGGGFEVRTQAYAYPFFVAVLYLLSSDSRSPSRRIYWTLPLLVLWANLHGSASLGAGLVALRGLTLAWERRSVRTRPLVLICGAPLCLLATPYGMAVIDYYHDTLFNGQFRKLVTEWRPVTDTEILAVPFFVVAGILLWSIGRNAGRLTAWERWALIALMAAGVTALRNVTWFALAALIFGAVSIDAGVRRRMGERDLTRLRFNRLLAVCAAVAVVAQAIITLTAADSRFTDRYPDGALAAVRSATAADGALRVYSDEKYSDWLLWRDPALRGRVAYDARFELLTHTELKRVAELGSVIGLDWKRNARGYRLMVLDEAGTARAAKALQREPGVRTLFRGDNTLVLLRRPDQARLP